MKNRQIILKKQPDAQIQSNDFELIETPFPKPDKGQIVGKTIYLSMDPALFGRLRDDDSYAERTHVGQLMQCYGIAQVVQSNDPKIKEGTFFFGNIGMQDFTVCNASEIRHINPYLGKLSWNLSLIGLAGVTAYFGLLDIGKPQKGETLVVSAAAGSVGMLVGQIGLIKGLKVIGICGSNEKADFLIHELGFTSALNYKSASFEQDLAEATPNGVDIYFDNVAGDLSNSLLPYYNNFARIILCGRMALTHLKSANDDIGMRDTTVLLRKRIKKQGFVVIDYEKRFLEAILQLLNWQEHGKIKVKEQIETGLEHVPEILLGLTTGINTGKLLVELAKPDYSKIKGGKFAAALIQSKWFPKRFLASVIKSLNS